MTTACFSARTRLSYTILKCKPWAVNTPVTCCRKNSSLRAHVTRGFTGCIRINWLSYLQDEGVAQYQKSYLGTLKLNGTELQPQTKPILQCRTQPINTREVPFPATSPCCLISQMQMSLPTRSKVLTTEPSFFNFKRFQKKVCKHQKQKIPNS